MKSLFNWSQCRIYFTRDELSILNAAALLLLVSSICTIFCTICNIFFSFVFKNIVAIKHTPNILRISVLFRSPHTALKTYYVFLNVVISQTVG